MAKAESDFDKLVEKSKKLEQGEYKTWVSFDALDVGKLMRKVFTPLALLSEKAPEAIEALLTAADKVDELVAILEKNAFAPAQAWIKVAKVIIKTILDLIDKVFALLLGGNIGGVDAKATSVIAPPHRVTHLPMAEKLPYALSEACSKWEERPSGKKVYGFIFFPYSLPLANLINKGADVVNERIKDIEEKGKEIKQMIDRMQHRSEKLESDYHDNNISQEEYEAGQDERYETIIEGMLTAVSEASILTYADNDEQVQERNVKILQKSISSEDDAASDALYMDSDMIGTGPVLLKRARLSFNLEKVIMRLVLDTPNEWWITSIYIVGQDDDGEQIAVNLYRNKYYDAMLYASTMNALFKKGADWAALTQTIDAKRLMSKIVDIIETPADSPIRGGMIGRLPPEGEDDLEDSIEIIAAVMTFIAMYSHCITKDNKLAGTDDEDSYYNSLTINYQQIQRLRAEKHVSVSNIFGSNTQSPLFYSLAVPEAQKEDFKKLGLEKRQAKLIIHTMSDPPYAFSDDFLVKGGDKMTPEGLLETIETYFDYYHGRYDVKDVGITGTYVCAVGDSPVIEKEYKERLAERLAHAGQAEATTPINTYSWYGVSTESLALKQLLPKKAVKNMHKAKREVDRTGKAILDALDLTSDMVSDTARITDMMRDVITRVLREDIVDIIKALADVASMPAMGMVVGVANVDASQIGELINTELHKANVHRNVTGGVIVVGGSAILSTLLDYFKLINEAKTKVTEIVSKIEGLTTVYGSSSSDGVEPLVPTLELPAIQTESVPPGEVPDIEPLTYTKLVQPPDRKPGEAKSVLYIGGGEDVEITTLITEMSAMLEKVASDKIKIPRFTRDFLLRGLDK